MESSDHEDRRDFKRQRVYGEVDDEEEVVEPIVPAVVDTVTVPDTAIAPQEEEHQPQSSDSESESSSEGEDVDLNERQQAIIKEMEESLEESDIEDRIRPDTETVSELRGYLHEHGGIAFLEEYCLEGSVFSPTTILGVLGFALRKEFVASYEQEEFRMFLPLAIQHFGKARRRLPSPRTMQELEPILERAKNILVLTGAGISTSLGIPDFRSKHGLYSKLEHLGLTDPQEVFDIRLFREDPTIFYTVAKEILPEHDTFTPTHAFIKLLHDKGKLLRNYTQNIDNLEGNAGIPANELVQCHGSFATATCQTCGYKVDGEVIYKEIRAGKVAKCQLCMRLKSKSRNIKFAKEEEEEEEEELGIMKPDITFFGEALPRRFDDLLFGPDGDARKCDLVICIGTSLKVAPVSEIIRIVPSTVPQIYINKHGVSHNEFDITFAGGCDDVVEYISEQMGWELTHEMNKRLNDWYRGDADPTEAFPGGSIKYVPELATYKFIEDDPS